MSALVRAILISGCVLGASALVADERSDAAAWCSGFTERTGVGCDVQRCPCGRTTEERERWDRSGLRISICACVSKSDLAELSDEPQCSSHADCSDGIWCNGAEQCQGGTCAPGTAPCPTGLCDERADACDSPCPDADGDGVGAIPCGADCDDNDPNRYPGNIEICDARGIDEDCDPRTVGQLDRDGDGFISQDCR